MAAAAEAPNPIGDAIMQSLPVQDTVHDFWAGARGELDLSDADLAKVRSGINALIGDPKLDNMSAVTGGLVKKNADKSWSSTPNDYERKLIDTYEKTYPDFLFAGTKESITYSEIVADTAGQVAKYKGPNRTCKILSITPAPDEYFDSFDTAARNRIGNFILNFMFPDRNIGAEISGITYDASPNAPRKVFADIEQMYNYIYPQNITDSAATSFKFKRITYEFPEDARVVRSNAFTAPGITMQYVKNGYGPLNRYGFNWRFTSAEGTIDLPFGPTQSDGPSVNYLLKSYLGTATGPEKANMINLAPLGSLKDSPLLFDIKRTGDFEQVNASLTNPNVIFATIDHLCSFYARINRKPCIWSNNNSTEMVLYRFDAPLDPAQNHLVSYQLRARLLGSWFTTIQSGELKTDLDSAIADFTRGIGAYYVTTSKFKKDLPGFINNIATVPFNIADPQTQVHVADALTTAIARLKCFDTVKYLQTEFVARIVEVDATLVANPIVLQFALNEGGEWSVVSPDGGATYQVALNGAPSGIETSINELQTLLNIPVPSKLLHIPGLVQNEFQINPKYSNVQLEVSGSDLKEFQLALRFLIGKLVTQRGDLVELSKEVKDLSDKFFKQRDGILSTFKDETLQSETQSGIDFALEGQITTDAGEVIAFPSLDTSEGLTALLGRIIQMVKNTVEFTNAKVSAPQVAGQRGGVTWDEYLAAFEEGVTTKLDRDATGDASIGQAFDMSVLFGDICGIAAAYVESVMSTVENGNLLLNEPPYIQVTAQTLHEIQDRWDTEITRIREQCLDIYGTGYVPTSSENRVWALLSEPNPSDILFVLTIFDNMTTVKGVQFFNHITPTLARGARFVYQAPREWTKLDPHIEIVSNAAATGALTPALIKLIRGGLRERRPLYRNARSVDVAIQSERDEGLREGRRTRRAPRIRQSARKSRSGGQRDDVDSV